MNKHIDWMIGWSKVMDGCKNSRHVTSEETVEV
jgi:hypothetical protein